MATKVMVAPVGDDLDALFVGVREFPIERVVLLTPKGREEEAEGAKKDLDKFKIESRIHKIEGSLWEGMYSAMSDIKKVEDEKDIIINVSTGDKVTSCIAVSAAFVNGLKAMGVMDGRAVMFPVLKFSYYKQLTDKKMNILKFIYDDKDCCSSLEELSKKTGMSLPLISYHVNGNLKSEGLTDLGLAETAKDKGKTAIRLTTMGKLLVKGDL